MEEQNIEKMRTTTSEKRKKITIGIAIGAAVLLFITLIILLVKTTYDKNEAVREKNEETAALQLQLDQERLYNEYDDLNDEFIQYEGQTIYFKNDSIRQEYEKAKNRVEELRRELDHQNKLSQKRIAELQGEIESLKGILRHYVEQINELQQENQKLTQQNEKLTRKNTELSNRVAETTSQNEELTQRMELAEKLNVSNVSLQPLKGNGKNEKKVKKAKQLAVTFTIPQNNSTPVGSKSIYVRITSPEGNLLKGNGITFPFEDGIIEASAKKDIEYEGMEISGVTIYWDNNTVLNSGEYLVELFADNYRLYSNNFTLK